MIARLASCGPSWWNWNKSPCFFQAIYVSLSSLQFSSNKKMYEHVVSIEVGKGGLLGVILNREFDAKSSNKSQNPQEPFNT